MPIVVRLDVELARNKMQLGELSKSVGVTLPNLSILKTGKAKAIRFSTLEAICKAMNCQPGNILEYVPDQQDVTEAKKSVTLPFNENNKG